MANLSGMVRLSPVTCEFHAAVGDVRPRRAWLRPAGQQGAWLCAISRDFSPGPAGHSVVPADTASSTEPRGRRASRLVPRFQPGLPGPGHPVLPAGAAGARAGGSGRSVRSASTPSEDSALELRGPAAAASKSHGLRGRVVPVEPAELHSSLHYPSRNPPVPAPWPWSSARTGIGGRHRLTRASERWSTWEPEALPMLETRGDDPPS